MLLNDTGEARLAADKLGTMWHSQVLSLVSMLVTFGSLLLGLVGALHGSVGGFGFVLLVSLAGVAAMLIGSIMYLAALYGLGPVDENYRRAFGWAVVGVVLSLIGSAVGEGSSLYQPLNIAASSLSLAVMWIVLQATGRLLAQAGREELAGQGRLAFWLSVASLVLNGVTEFFTALLAALEGAAAGGLVVLLIALAMSIAGAILYILYLRSAASAMAAYALEGKRRLEAELERERGANKS